MYDIKSFKNLTKDKAQSYTTTVFAPDWSVKAETKTIITFSLLTFLLALDVWYCARKSCKKNKSIVNLNNIIEKCFMTQT